MSRMHIWRRSQHLSAFFCLLLLLSACSQLSGNKAASTSTPEHTATPLTLITSTPENLQSCPQSAFVSHLPTSTHPTLVYVAQEGNSSVLQRYDVTTGSRQTILQTLSGGTIQKANISPDGQWIVFVSLLQGQETIQMIGVNGQQLKMLYCVPAQETIDDAILSPDQRSLAFNEANMDGLSSLLYLLDMKTGKLRTLLSPFQPNFPEVAPEPMQTSLLSERLPSSEHYQTRSRLALFNPLASSHDLIYIPMKWASNTSLYVYGTIRGSGATIHQLARLLDTRKDATQQGSNLQAIKTAGPNFVCEDDDVTPDNTELVCSALIFTPPTAPVPDTIKMWSITDGKQRVVFQGQPGESIIARAITNSTLLFLFTKSDHLPTLCKINTDGTGLLQLMGAPTTNAELEFAASSYLPWSITSRDGEYYALIMNATTSTTSSVIVGNLNGGQSKTIVSSTNPIQIAGWA